MGLVQLVNIEGHLIAEDGLAPLLVAGHAAVGVGKALGLGCHTEEGLGDCHTALQAHQTTSTAQSGYRDHHTMVHGQALKEAPIGVPPVLLREPADQLA